MSPRNLATLQPFDEQTSTLRVVVESPRGSGVKLKYNPALDIFELSYVLAAGLIFPFDLGFIPSTLAEDGDPLDALVLLDAATCVGCVLLVRPVGAIEAEQTQDGRTFRNDRLITIAAAAHQLAQVKSLADLNHQTINEIEHFFITYNEMRGRRFKPIRRVTPDAALDLVRRAHHAATANNGTI